MRRPTRANKPDGYLLGSYRIATALEPNSSRLTSFKSIRFDSPATLRANMSETPTPFEFSVEGGEAKAHGFQG